VNFEFPFATSTEVFLKALHVFLFRDNAVAVAIEVPSSPIYSLSNFRGVFEFSEQEVYLVER
jgi:hypothetical protein